MAAQNGVPVNRNEHIIGGKKYKVLKKRWAVLIIVSTILLLDTFSASFFGFINNITSIYFQMPPAVIDLLSTVNMIARSVFGFVIALAGSTLDLRNLSLMTCSTIVAGDLLIASGVSSRKNFAITVMGQILNGFGAAMSLTVSQMSTSNWFPSSERGRAVAMPWVLRRLSPVISNIIATQTILYRAPEKKGNLTLEEQLEQNGDLSYVLWEFRRSCFIAYLSLSVVAGVGYLLSYLFVTNYPPRVDGEQDSPAKKTSWNPCTEIRGIWDLFSNGQFLLLFMCYVFVLSVRPLTEWLLSSVFLAAFSDYTDSTAGIMFCVGYTFGALGPPSAGYILDKFRRPKLTFAVGICFVIASIGIFSLGLHIRNFPLTFVFFCGITYFRDFTFVCLSHSFVEILHSRDDATKVRGFSISGSAPWISLAVYTVFIRLTLDKYGASFASLIPIPFQITAVLLYLAFYRPPQDYEVF